MSHQANDNGKSLVNLLENFRKETQLEFGLLTLKNDDDGDFEIQLPKPKEDRNEFLIPELIVCLDDAKCDGKIQYSSLGFFVTDKHEQSILLYDSYERADIDDEYTNDGGSISI